MSYKPILFSSEMVRALLEGRKTQTRRIIKAKYSNTDICWKEDKYGKRLIERQNDAPPPETIVDENGKTMTRHHLVAYREIPRRFSVGDVLWVRETFSEEGFKGNYIYKADGVNLLTDYDAWKPSIFMPKEACRLFLRITDIRVERVQSISEGDAIAEGVESWIEQRMRSKPMHYKIYYQEPGDESTYSSSAAVSYETLWQKINGTESWQANPWVWALTFKQIDKPEKFN